MTGGGANANMLFGGVDSLLVGNEDSQDWWLKDQSTLAHGFENWVVDPNIDWASMGLEVGDNIGSTGDYQTFNDDPGSAGLTNGFAAFPSNLTPSKQNSNIASTNGLGYNGQRYQANFDDMYF